MAMAASQSTAEACAVNDIVAPQNSRSDTETTRRHNLGCMDRWFPGGLR